MKLFKCEPCEKTFTDQDQLDKHLLLNHKGKSSEKSVIESDSFEKHSPQTQHTNNNGDFKCDQCAKVFSSNSKLQSHVNIHSDIKPYKCPICRQSFRYKQQIREHKNRHAGIKPYKCHLCEKSFTVDSELKLHLNYHAGIKPFECGYCRKKFAQHAHWKAHLRTHTGDKPFKCDLCPKSFRQKSHLSVHKNIHTKNNKSFECSVCKEKFRLPHTLKSHMTRHTGQKPYKCKQCPLSFSQSTPLNHHIQKSHGNNQVSCEYENCDKVFASGVQLKAHLKTHFQVRRYFCLFCGKGCFKNGDLMNHLRSHTQERPYVCSICDSWYPSTSRRKACQDSHIVSNSKKIIPVHDPPPPPQLEVQNPGKFEPPKLSVIETVSLKLQCKICNKFMKHQNQLNGHMGIHKRRKKKGKKITKRKQATTKTKETTPFIDPLTEFVPDDNDDIEIEYHTNDEADIATFCITNNTETEEKRSRSPSPPQSELRIESVRHIPLVTEISQQKKPTNFRPFQCEFCNKMYAEKGALDKHMNIHGVVIKKSSPQAKVKVPQKNTKPFSTGDHQATTNSFKAKRQQQSLVTPEMEENETTPVMPPAILEIFDDDVEEEEEEEQECGMPELEKHTDKADNDPFPIPPVLVDETRDDRVTKLLNEVITLDDEVYNSGACATPKKNQLDGHTCDNDVPKSARFLDPDKESVGKVTLRSTSTSTTGTTPIPIPPVASATAKKKRKSFRCNICKRFFGNPGALAGHKKTHIRDTNKIVCCVCRICWKSFPTKSELESHMKSHVNI